MVERQNQKKKKKESDNSCLYHKKKGLISYIKSSNPFQAFESNLLLSTGSTTILVFF